MTKLDILVIEGHAGEGSAAAAKLEAAGHRVHRCWDPPSEDGGAERVPLRDRYLCTGVTHDSCPLVDGVDVALLVRDEVRPEPTAREAAVTCAIRAGVPVVEDGPALLDPFAPWVAVRGGRDVVALCEKGAQESFDPLGAEIAVRIHPLLVIAEVDPNEVTSTFEVEGPRLIVRLHGPALDGQVEQALCVRVLDALGATRRTFRRVDVGYEADSS